MLAKRNDYSLPIDLIIVIRPCYSTEAYEANEEELNASLDQIREKLN